MTATLTVPEVHLRPRKALPFFSHHPWVYQSAVTETPADLAPGAEVALRSAEGKFVARGLFNPHSNIRVRLYSWAEDLALDHAFWAQRLDEAIALRHKLFGEFTPDSACRLVYSEADQLSGLVIDRYGEWLVVQFTALAMAQRQDLWFDLLEERLKPKGILIRTEKGIRDVEGLEIADGLIRGEAPPRPMFLSENGVRYGVDLSEGQKTGFFLDQRDNRHRLGTLTENARVLDMFCYSGGFGLSALVNGGATEVIGIDSSEGAVTLAKQNAQLNGVAERMHVTKEDGFKALERLAAEGQRFDVVVLDPPKLARRREALEAALRGYFSLNRLAVDVLQPGGLLMTCSCSGVVTHQHFVETLANVGLDAGRHVQILEARGPSADHPASIHCLETDYLKCYLCRVV
jgi:23S rRNA (cytosine1962-C5)-methyltransferase